MKVLRERLTSREAGDLSEGEDLADVTGRQARSRDGGGPRGRQTKSPSTDDFSSKGVICNGNSNSIVGAFSSNHSNTNKT